MAFLNEEFNVDDLPQSGGFDPLPAGWYQATIAKAEVKSTKSGDGQYIAVGYTITGPTHEGRMVFGNLNIKNKNQKAEEIGRQQLGDIMRSIGLSKVTDTDQLIGGTLSIKLTVKLSDEFGDGNEVKGFKAIAGSSMPASAKPSAFGAKPAPAAAPKSSAPWAK